MNKSCHLYRVCIGQPQQHNFQSGVEWWMKNWRRQATALFFIQWFDTAYWATSRPVRSCPKILSSIDKQCLVSKKIHDTIIVNVYVNCFACIIYTGESLHWVSANVLSSYFNWTCKVSKQTRWQFPTQQQGNVCCWMTECRHCLSTHLLS